MSIGLGNDIYVGRRPGVWLSGGGAAAFVGAYDAIPSITAAYGMRRLLSSYTGNILRLRRASDNAESDFGYVANGDLDTAAIATWLTATTGYVVTWYDQSGGSKNATQTTAAAQPLYVASGQNSKPVARFEGNDVLAEATLSFNLAARSIMCVALENTQVNNAGLVALRPAAGNDYDRNDASIMETGTSTQRCAVIGGVDIAYAIAPVGTLALPISVLVEVFGSGTGELWRNGASQGTDTHASFTTSGGGVVLGGRYVFGAVAATNRLNGDMMEVVIASAAWDATVRGAAQTAANAYWGVY